jgi:hypothetical protein
MFEEAGTPCFFKYDIRDLGYCSSPMVWESFKGRVLFLTRAVTDVAVNLTSSISDFVVTTMCQ